MDRIKVSLLGSTGVVGQKMIKLLEHHPDIELVKVSASPLNTGKKYRDAVKWVEPGNIPEKFGDLKIVSSEPEEHRDVDYVLSALPSEIAESIELKLIKNKINVISNASPYRMNHEIPLINPELNYNHLNLIENMDTKFVKNPNCTSTIMSMPLAEILNLDYRSINLVTLQAISGAGFAGLPYMSIDDNIIPYINGEEEKIPREISKMFGYIDSNKIVNKTLKMHITSLRVPVKIGHMGIMNIELNEKIDVNNLKNRLKNFRPLRKFNNLYNAPENPIVIHEENNRPQNIMDTYSGMEVHIGRIEYTDNNLRLIILGNNLVRGAAGITVLTLETMKEMKLI